MKSPAERGPDGLWLYQARKARGFTNAEDARTAVQRATGTHIAHSVYVQYEAGTRAISQKHRPSLESYWGPRPEPVELATTLSPDVAALVARLDRQAEVIDRLAASVELLSRGQAEMLRGLVEGLAELASGRADDPASAVPAGTPR